MLNLFNKVITYFLWKRNAIGMQSTVKLNSLVAKLQTKQFLSIVFIGFLILTINTELVPLNNQALGNQLNNEIHQDGESRPKTTEEWSQQASETDGRPVERLKRVGVQTTEALKDFGEMYKDTFPQGGSK